MAANDFPVIVEGGPVSPTYWYNPVAEGVTALRQQLLALQALTPVSAFKLVDESVNSGGSGTTLQSDDALVVTGLPNTKYAVQLALMYTEAAGTGIDIKCAWTQPAGCTLNLAVAGPALAWTGAAAAAEAEWSAWQNQTGSPTGTISFGSTNAAALSMQASGTWFVGSTGGALQFQWAQFNLSASNLTVKAGSSLIITPVP